MNIEDLKKAHDVMQKLDSTRALVKAYQEAPTLAVSIPQRDIRGSSHSIAFDASEIGDAIVTALERRIVKLQAQLRELGVEEETKAG